MSPHILSIVIPFKDEIELLPKLIDDIVRSVALEKEIVVVYDDESSAIAKRTEEVVKNLLSTDEKEKVKFIRNKYRRGVANAIKTAIESCTGDPIVFMTADLSDDPKVLPLMVEKIHSGADIVCGSRFSKGGGYINGNILKRILSQIAGLSLHYIAGIPTKDITNTFKMFKRKVLKDVEIKSIGFEWAMQVTCEAFLKGYKISEVPYVWREMRTGGKKSNFNPIWIKNYLRIYISVIANRIKRMVLARMKFTS